MADNIPFLTIITRCCRRPTSLSRCLASVAQLPLPAPIEHLLIVDRERKGIVHANSLFHIHRALPRGSYVYALDDDSWLQSPTFATALHEAATLANYPDILLLRSFQRDPNWTIMPPQSIWDLDWEGGERPTFWIGSGYCYAVKRELWQPTVHHYYKGQGEEWSTGGDWRFMTALLKLSPTVARAATLGGTGSRQKGKRFERGVGKFWFERTIEDLPAERIDDDVWRITYE